MEEDEEFKNSLEGQFLIATPGMGDDRFNHSVIYICSHTAEGALGLVVNQLTDEITFPELLEQLEIKTEIIVPDLPIHYGGPVELGRGFVLHTLDYASEYSTMMTSDNIGLTATVDILKAIAIGEGPLHSMIALGYAGWGPGQLESEIMKNGWLTVEGDEDILFDDDYETKWDRAMKKVGVDPRLLSLDSGQA